MFNKMKLRNNFIASIIASIVLIVLKNDFANNQLVVVLILGYLFTSMD